ncbi:ribonuclease R [Altererythrobacter sp.]|uniref:ribonuclease R n=1 Tax=Altererythrobacter sp. TaxID=1872480 RepID=UPI001AFD5509|nr:ribonuclease R [Altererythrobacter sp.]MBO6608335.1 ribonuclease R [Altererythrobacter sp.]MBO6641408.1 ribonuclease R [Altererythrobacter sp.]MBO6707893.1 ribonuclease R [Altererythrobacter sp.]MBO6945975.1 ribonuclease R [Altererythrobacter sp.]
MAKRPARRPSGLPSKEQVLEFLQTSDTPAGKREIAKAFGLKGQEKIALKRLLKDMAEEGLIDGKKTAYHRMGGVPKVTVLRVVEIEDGEAIAIPDNWSPDAPGKPPRLTMREMKGRGGKRMPALKRGDRVLSRTEETESGWTAHPMKKLPARTEGLMGVVEIDGSGKAWLAPVDKRIRNSSPIADLGEAEEGQLVIAERVGRSERSGVKVTEVIGDPLAPRSFSLIAIAKHGIPHVFPEEALREAEIAAQLKLSDEHLEDLRDIPIVAIDPADARDHDDAIWAEPDGQGGFNAIVAIADVSFYVRPGTALDKEARKRGNSVYFPDRVVPMLPEVLSANVCSLKEGEDRAAMVCHLHVDKEGAVDKTRFTRAIVRIHHNIAYENAQASIHDGSAPRHLVDLWNCWRALEKARHARDPLELELPERRVVLDEKGQIAEIAVRERLDAHRVVEDFMIAANVAAAKALEAKTAPVVYRVHEPPAREKLIALRDYLATFGRKLALGQVITPSLFNRMLKDVSDEGEKAQVMEAVLRSQMQAYYGPQNAGHFGLALGSYAHFTSPIRRYSDLLVHRALVDAYKLEQPETDLDVPDFTGLSDRDRSNLQQITDAISQTERRAMEAERDTIDRYVAAWLSARVGEIFDTRITGVQGFGFFATIIGLGGDGLVPVSTLGREHFRFEEAAQALVGEDSGTRYAMGDTLQLKLAEANPLTGSLKFVPVDADGQEIEPRGARPAPRYGHKKKGKFMTNKRGRPANIRHQGRRKR